MAAQNVFVLNLFCQNILDRESEYLFAIFDSNNDGNIDIAEELNIRYKTLKSDYIFFINFKSTLSFTFFLCVLFHFPCSIFQFQQSWPWRGSMMMLMYNF